MVQYSLKEVVKSRKVQVLLFSIIVVALIIFFASKINANVVAGKISGSNLEKVYDQQTQTLVIKNSTNSEMLRAQLESNLDVVVGRGYQMVAWMNTSKDFLKYFKDFNLYNLSSGKDTARQIDFKYFGDVVKYKYNYTCTNNVTPNGTVIQSEPCKKEIIGNYTTKGWINIDMNSLDSLPDYFTLGLFTNVEKGDHIEWVPNFQIGKNVVNVNEWASWTENLSAGLVSYYKLDEYSGPVKDELGKNDGININTETGVPGVIGNAYSFHNSDGSEVDIPKSDSLKITEDYSVCAWVNMTGIPPQERAIVGDGSSAIDSGHLLFLSLYGYPRFSVKQSDGFLLATLSQTPLEINTWNYLCGVYTAGQNLSLYVNGHFDSSNSDGVEDSGLLTSDDFTIGDFSNPRTIDAVIDEVGIWNRPLTDSEILDLYNEGAGIPYLGNTPPQITINSPQDLLQTEFSTISFSVTPIQGNASTQVLNVSLYTNRSGWNIESYNDSSFNNTNTVFTLSGLPDGVYLWNARVQEGNLFEFAKSNLTFIVQAGGVRILNETQDDISTSYNLSINNVSIITLPVSANTNYTFTCNLVGNSSVSTTGIRINITTPLNPTYFRASIVNPPTSTTPLFIACSGTNNWCNASGTAASVQETPIDIEGRLINGPNYGVINITLGSEINGTPITIKKESMCWIMEEN